MIQVEYSIVKNLGSKPVGYLQVWPIRADSNPGPLGCESDALTTRHAAAASYDKILSSQFPSIIQCFIPSSTSLTKIKTRKKNVLDWIFSNLISTANVSNYRAISLLSIFNKLFEKHILLAIKMSKKTWRCIFKGKFGFCPKHSTDRHC